MGRCFHEIPQINILLLFKRQSIYKRATGVGARPAARHLAGLSALAHTLDIWQSAFASVSFSHSHSYIKSHKGMSWLFFMVSALI